MAEIVSSATLLASARIVCTSLVNFLKTNKQTNNEVILILSANEMLTRGTNLLYLVIIAIKLRDDADERESHDGHQRELPGQPEHEDEEAGTLNDASQEDVHILGDEVTHLGGVS